ALPICFNNGPVPRVYYDIVVDRASRRACLEIRMVGELDARTPRSGHDDGVIDDGGVLRGYGPVDAEAGNASGIRVIDQIIIDERVLHPVHIDGSRAARACDVDYVSVYFCALDIPGNFDAFAELGEKESVAVHVDTGAHV